MASIVYLHRAPKYKGVTLKQLKLTEKYFRWEKECIKNLPEMQLFEKYCGHSISELPDKDTIEYLRPFYERKHIEEKGDFDTYICMGLFEQVARMPKASQFVYWIMRNVINTENIPFGETHELSKEHLENLLEACNRVRRYAITTRVCNNPSNYSKSQEDYIVKKEIAHEILPIISFPWDYHSLYAFQIIRMIRILNDILSATNFETHTIYFTFS